MRLRHLSVSFSALAVLGAASSFAPQSLISSDLMPSFGVPEAQALSCMRPDIIRALEDAKRSDDLYYVLDGTFLVPLSGPVVPPYPPVDINPEDQFKPKPPVMTRVIFNGRALTNNPRTDVPLSGFAMDIQTSCLGPWCSSLPSGDGAQIAFVQVRDGDVPLLNVGPCPQWTFKSEAKRVDMIRRCLDKNCGVGEHGDPIHNPR